VAPVFSPTSSSAGSPLRRSLETLDAGFDTSGRAITTLFDRVFAKGDHTFDWESAIPGKSIPAGPYLFQRTVENNSGIFRRSKVLTIK
jgi:hypothetical protein